LIRLQTQLSEALLLLMGFVAHSTGTEPGQEEIAAALRSYFTLDEVTNQINYLRKKPVEEEDGPLESPKKRAALRVNMIGRPTKNSLARAGFFTPGVVSGIEAIRKHAKACLGAAPSDEEIARSLRSSFILSELKNQIVYSRRNPQRKP
jgi:hypothetical protein